MRAGRIYLIAAVMLLTRCSSMPDKVVFEKLSTEELAKAIKRDTAFASFYEALHKQVDGKDDLFKAKYIDLSYERLFKYYKFLNDTSYWNPKYDQWEIDWKGEFGMHIPKADSTIKFWKNYLVENSLSRFVKIELASIKKEYYSYIGGLKEVHLGFRMTPLMGPIEQVRFNYGFVAKINDDFKVYEKNYCIDTDPLYGSRVGYWEVSYPDRDKFIGKTVETFLRDFNIYIEVTNVRKNGKNLSADDLKVPDEVKKCIEVEDDYPVLYRIYREELIKSLIFPGFISELEYYAKKQAEIRENRDALCFNFLKEL